MFPLPHKCKLCIWCDDVIKNEGYCTKHKQNVNMDKYRLCAFFIHIREVLK